MDYRSALKKIISGQYLYSGIRTTAATIIPALVLYHYNVLVLMSAIPLGALVVSLTDSPGPFHHRRNTILASICINFLVVVTTISIHHNPVFIAAAIIVFGMFFSLLGVYGNRANSIGLIALLVFIFNIDSKASFNSAWLNGLLFTAGGAWYFVLSMFLNTLRPFRYIQQQLGENIRQIAGYMDTLAGLFKIEGDDNLLREHLRQQQVTIQQQQDSLREMLLSTREMIIDSTVKGRSLMMMFLDSIDLLEQLLTLQQDYSSLREEFKESGVFSRFNAAIEIFNNELNSIGLSVQLNEASKIRVDIDGVLQQLLNAFFEERKKRLNKNTLASFIRLRQIVYAFQDIGERIKRLHRYTKYEKKFSREYRTADEEIPVATKEISPAMFAENLSLRSSQFRHAVRLTLAMLTGYIISLLFPLGHGYWILLTIVTILKPAYSISRTRNAQRLFGTLTGVVIGFTFLYFVSNSTLVFAVLLVTMVIAYSLLKVNYYLSSACITIYVLISIHFLNNSNFTVTVQDRVIDTIIGCFIAFIASYSLFPLWEREQMNELIGESLDANKNYFNEAAMILIMKNINEKNYKAVRKKTFVALANLGDNFQRMLSEPKSKQEQLSYYHQFVASSYMLTAHIASLSAFAKRAKQYYNANDFEPLINKINDKFKKAINASEGKKSKPVTSNRNAPIINKVQALLQQRQKEIEAGIKDLQTELRRTVAALKAITDEFEIIESIVNDEIKILQKIISQSE